MNVTYYGKTEGNHFGSILYECDRYLKSMAAGKDNITEKPVKTNVPGYSSQVKLSLKYGHSSTEPYGQQSWFSWDKILKPLFGRDNDGDDNSRWHRLWFFPSDISLSRSADGQTMVFDKAEVKVEARFVRFRDDGTKEDIPGHDKAVDGFVDHFNQHYDDFAREKPELKKLVQLARVVGVVKWLKENNIPIDLDQIRSYKVKNVDTPAETPGILVEDRDGQRLLRHYGGVDLSSKHVKVEEDEKRTMAIKEELSESQPKINRTVWTFPLEGKPHTAVSLSIGKRKYLGWRLKEVDYAGEAKLGIPFTFIRLYNFAFQRSGPFGRGWSFLPYRLHVPGSEGKVIIEVDGKKLDVYREIKLVNLIDEKADFFRPGNFVTTDSATGKMIEKRIGYFSETKEDNRFLMQKGKDKFVLTRAVGTAITFDKDGNLLSIEDDQGNRIDYIYKKGRLVRIKSPEKSFLFFRKSIDLIYDSNGRVIELDCPDGKKITYNYDSNGNLEKVTDSNGNEVVYGYDEDHSLISRLDVWEGLHYDNWGRVVKRTGTASNYVAYKYCKNHYSMSDVLGNVVSFKYSD